MGVRVPSAAQVLVDCKFLVFGALRLLCISSELFFALFFLKRGIFVFSAYSNIIDDSLR